MVLFFFFFVRDAVCDAGGEWCGDRMMRRLGGCWRGFYVGWGGCVRVAEGEVRSSRGRGGERGGGV